MMGILCDDPIPIIIAVFGRKKETFETLQQFYFIFLDNFYFIRLKFWRFGNRFERTRISGFVFIDIRIFVFFRFLYLLNGLGLHLP